MTTSNITLATDWTDSGLAASKDYDLQWQGTGAAEWAIAASAPASTFRGRRLFQHDVCQAKIGAGLKLFLKRGPGATAAGVLVTNEVP